MARPYQSPWKPRTSPCMSCFTRTSWTPSKVSEQNGVIHCQPNHLPSRVQHMVGSLLCEKLWCNWFSCLKLSCKDRKTGFKHSRESEGIEFNSCHKIAVMSVCLFASKISKSIDLTSFYPVVLSGFVLFFIRKEIAKRVRWKSAAFLREWGKLACAYQRRYPWEGWGSDGRDKSSPQKR